MFVEKDGDDCRKPPYRMKEHIRRNRMCAHLGIVSLAFAITACTSARNDICQAGDPEIYDWFLKHDRRAGDNTPAER